MSTFTRKVKQIKSSLNNTHLEDITNGSQKAGKGDHETSANLSIVDKRAQSKQYQVIQNKMDRSASTNKVSQLQEVIQKKGEPATYRKFLVALAEAGYAGASKAHVPHRGSEVKAHFYTDKIAEARAFALKYPNAGVNLAQVTLLEATYT